MLSALEIEESVRNAWKDIEKWYGENTPNLLQSLQPGASEQQLNDFETRVGFSLSKDYWASLKIHNGNVYVHDYCYLSLEGVLVNWEIMTNLVKRGDFDDRSSLGQGVIQNVWWHSKLIPFAEDSAGNQLCIDMSPGPDGVLGQIVYYETEEGLLVSPYTSFLEWLTNYRDELYQGMYKVEDGFLYKK
jgi:cell wall assembly regulator SMI1